MTTIRRAKQRCLKPVQITVLTLAVLLSGASHLSAATGCPSQSVTWYGSGGEVCSGMTQPMTGEARDTLQTDMLVENTAPGFAGEAAYQCVNGTLSQETALHTPSCFVDSVDCPSETVSWTVGSDTCSANQGVLADGTSGGVTDSTGPTTGSATFSCSAGVRTVQGGATCATSPSPCVPVDSACGATGTAMLNGVCTTGAYDGWRVSGGVWVECTNPVVTCPAQTLSWTVGAETCSSDTNAANAGNLVNLRDSSTPGVGIATFYCSGSGLWSVQSGATCSAAPTCNSPPPPCGVENHVED